MAESKMPARISVGKHTGWSADDTAKMKGDTPYIRADLVEPLVEALRIIAGQQQCIDNLMSNGDVARAALQAYEAAILRARQTEATND